MKKMGANILDSKRLDKNTLDDNICLDITFLNSLIV